jgi:hypothetical protein
MKNKTSITLEIKGRTWEFILINDKTFDKHHNPNDEHRTAMTLPNQYCVHFRKSDWCFEDIVHELGHVLFHMSENHVADLTPDQVEEIMCQIMAKNYFDIGRFAGLIAERFFGRE